MPWQECSRMSSRLEFVTLATKPDANVAELCRRFRVSRKTGYKWIERFNRGGAEALADQSRRPRCSPTRTDDSLEQQVVQLRERHPAWGGRKLHHRLKALGCDKPPAPSTITSILHRHDLIDPCVSRQHEPLQRFERPRPNDLWQMDFKGDFALANGKRCHPLTVLDDHSRYSLGLRACMNQQFASVQQELTHIYQHFGLPRAMLMDNGTPWGVCGRIREENLGLTRLTVWMMRLDIEPIHGRPYHPQTQGKDERFHGTLKRELLRDQVFDDHPDAQNKFDPWREVYNFDRPHEALGMATPAQRYQPSERSFPAKLPELEYLGEDEVRSVNPVGQIQFKRRTFKLSEAFGGHRVGLRATAVDGVWAVYFGRFHVADLSEHTGKAARPRRLLPVATLPPADDAECEYH